jgi:hypothetical protein
MAPITFYGGIIVFRNSTAKRKLELAVLSALGQMELHKVQEILAISSKASPFGQAKFNPLVATEQTVPFLERPAFPPEQTPQFIRLPGSYDLPATPLTLIIRGINYGGRSTDLVTWNIDSRTPYCLQFRLWRVWPRCL